MSWLRLYGPRLFNAVKHDVKQKYAGSVLGSFWAILYPLFMVSFYATIYVVIFRVRVPNLSPEVYTVLVMSGLSAVLMFSESLSAGLGAIINQRSLLMNTVFPAGAASAKIRSCKPIAIVGGADHCKHCFRFPWLGVPCSYLSGTHHLDTSDHVYDRAGLDFFFDSSCAAGHSARDQYYQHVHDDPEPDGIYAGYGAERAEVHHLAQSDQLFHSLPSGAARAWDHAFPGRNDWCCLPWHRYLLYWVGLLPARALRLRGLCLI